MYMYMHLFTGQPIRQSIHTCAWLEIDSALLTSLLATLFIMTFSGRSIVLATARTISLACCLVGQSNRLYRTVCFLVQRRSSSSARRTVGSLLSSVEEKYRSRSKEAWSGVASSPVSCWEKIME